MDAQKLATTLVRTLAIAGAVQSVAGSEEEISAYETAARASVDLRAALGGLPGFEEFAVVKKTFLRSLRLRAVEACARRGRDASAADRRTVLDRGAVHALNILESCKEGGGAGGGFYGTEMKLEVSGDAKLSFWMTHPEDAHNGTVTHFLLPLAGSSLVLGLRARRDGAHAAACAYLAQAAMHFPPDDLQKVVATWLLADCLTSCGGAVEVGSVRAVAAAAINVEAKFREGAFGAAVGIEHLPPRGRVRALLRKTSALADDAALPGPAIEGAGANMMRTAGGGKVVAGLIDGKNAPPPGTVDLLSRLGQVDIS